MTPEYDANPLEFISQIEEFVEMYEFLGDDDFQDCLDLALKLIVKPDVPSMRVNSIIVKLTAYSVKFRMHYVYHMGLGKKTEGAAIKKNIYRSTYEGIDRLVDSLKYLSKAQ